MDDDEIRLKLNELAMAEMEQQAIAERKARLKEDSLDELQREVLKAVSIRNADIDSEFSAEESALVSREGILRMEIQKGVEEQGRSIIGDRKIAVFIPGRRSADIGKLEGYGAAHPEVMTFLKIGKPSVTIRDNPKAGK